MYSFRLRFHLRDGDRIGIDSEAVQLLENDKVTWRLRSGEGEDAIRAHSHASILAKEFRSEVEAREAGKDCRAALLAWAVYKRLGIDLGNDIPFDGAQPAYLVKVAADNGVPARNDIHGLDVFRSAPRTAFVHAKGTANSMVDGSTFLNEITKLLASPPKMTDKVSLAAELFTSSFLDVAPRPRFVILTSAVEALLEPRKHEAAVQDFVTETEKRLNELTVSKQIRDSLRGSIKWLKQESISRAGENLATTRLSGLTYDKKAPDLFFHDCYGLRSDLVHRGTSGLTMPELSHQADWLAVFVGDLLNQLIFGAVNRPATIICGYECDDRGKVRWRTLDGDLIDGPPDGLGSIR